LTLVTDCHNMRRMIIPEHIQIIALWSSHEALAKDVGAKAPAVRKWQQRGRIPSGYWPKIVKTKTAEEHGIKTEDLSEPAEKPAHKNRSAA
jgi:hypothetical protein